MVILLALVLALAAAPPPSTLDARWVVPFDTAPSAPPAFDADTAYVPLASGALVAVDLDRGSIRWRRDISTTLAPAVGGGLVYVAGEGLIEALDARTGLTRWRLAFPGRLAAPLAWDTGWLLGSTEAGDFAALRADDGTLVWRVSLGAPVVHPSASGGDRLYVALGDGRLLSLALVSGARSWERRFAGRITGLRAFDDQLVVGTTENVVESLDLRTGRQRWRWRVGGDVSGDPAADERLLYFVSRDHSLRAVDRRSGNMRWNTELPSRPIGGPQRDGDLVWVPLSNEIAAFDPVTGKAVTTLKAAGEISASPYFRPAAPASGARLVAMSRDGQLQGFGLRNEPPPAPLDALPGVVVQP